MDIEILTLTPGRPRWDQLVSGILADDGLVEQMWADAEHEPADYLGATLSMVLVDGIPAAWAGSIVQEISGVLTLKCRLNYERRGAGRDLGLYALAYEHRHRTVVAPSVLPQITYLFAAPIALHEADGWRRTGHAGMSDQGHRWWELRRDPTA